MIDFITNRVAIIFCVLALILAVSCIGCSSGSSHSRPTTSKYLADQVLVGTRLYREGRYQDAEQQYRKVISMSPQYFFVHGLIGRCLEGQHKYGAAASEYRKVVEDPGSSVMNAENRALDHENYGRALVESGDIKNGSAELKYAIAECPSNMPCGKMDKEANLLLNRILKSAHSK